MNKAIKKILTLVTAFAVTITSFVSVNSLTAQAADPVYTKTEVTAHIYEKNVTEKINVLKRSDMDRSVWISAMDFLKHDFNDTVSFSITNDGDIYTIKKSPDNATMVVDVANDTVTFDKMEVFIDGEQAFAKKGSLLDNPYVEQSVPEYIPDTKVNAAVLDLKKYGLDLVGMDGQVYFPIATISDIFGWTYNAAVYVDGEVYFVPIGDDRLGNFFDPYVNKSSIYNVTTRSAAEIEAEYNEFSFVMDNIYGCPGSCKYADSIKNIGFDSTMDLDSDVRRIKEMLKSPDLFTYDLGLEYMNGAFYDGGHTITFMPDYTLPVYADTALAKAFAESDENEELDKEKQKYMESRMPKSLLYARLEPLRNKAYLENPNLVKEWKDERDMYVAAYVRTVDKGIYSFDTFSYDMVPSFIWSLNHAAANGVKDFYIDLSMNGGGDERIVEYIMSIMTGTGNMYYKNAITGNRIVVRSKVDKNLDGVFDEKDDAVKYNFNFKIVTSPISFSCGNALPCYAAKAGIPIYGQRSGGGTCTTFSGLFHTTAQGYGVSSYNIIVDSDGNDLEAGAPVTADWTRKGVDGNTDYSSFYDFLKTTSSGGSSSSGGSGGTSNVSSTTKTTTNSDGSKTTVIVSKNKTTGIVTTTTTTKKTDGSKEIIKTVADKNGTITDICTSYVSALGSEETSVYSVKDNSTGAIKLKSIETTEKKVAIPANILVDGRYYKVTRIGEGVLKNNKKVTSISIGKNVTAIGKNAFSGTSKLKEITIKGNIKSIGKNAFSGINKKAIIKIKASKANYKKIVKRIKKAGAPKTVTYRKQSA